MDLESGRVTFIRQRNDAEATFIRGIRPSPCRNYVVVLLKAQYDFLVFRFLSPTLILFGRPFQIFDLKTGGLMKSINVPLQITAFSWNDPSTRPLPYPFPGKEEFVFTTCDLFLSLSAPCLINSSLQARRRPSSLWHRKQRNFPTSTEYTAWVRCP